MFTCCSLADTTVLRFKIQKVLCIVQYCSKLTGNKLLWVQKATRARHTIHHATQAQAAGAWLGMPSGMPHREATFDGVFPKPPPKLGKVQQADFRCTQMAPELSMSRMILVQGPHGIHAMPAASFPAFTQV
jgi:hypothetical protein